MSTTTLEEKNATKDLVDMCRVYLRDNFHKFNEYNKIRISLALIQKSMPTQLEGNITFTEMKDIRVENRLQEFLVGDNRS
jgi:hypothetical protein